MSPTAEQSFRSSNLNGKATGFSKASTQACEAVWPASLARQPYTLLNAWERIKADKDNHCCKMYPATGAGLCMETFRCPCGKRKNVGFVRKNEQMTNTKPPAETPPSSQRNALPPY